MFLFCFFVEVYRFIVEKGKIGKEEITEKFRENGKSAGERP